MESALENQALRALRAYVAGDSSEPIILSAFRQVPLEERAPIVARHRHELQAIDDARLLIVESLLLPLDHRPR